MNEERLMERIRIWKADPSRRGRADTRKRIDSVVNHLKNILNTRQGNVPIADDYGIPDLTNFMQNYPDSLQDIESGIRKTIETYEPRLTNVKVSYIRQEEAVISLRFQITAEMKEYAGNSIKIETIVDPDGKVFLKE
jgi:type VI secretion system protein